ncbi:nitronate monooxygenase [Candidatus Parcubacteria bacterium]|nr:MAG: nitronate monooxygenase [Candidatus Parcubacteria bacterium]
MRVPKFKIGQFVFERPIWQGAMGVRVSAHPLPAAVAEEGCVGTITSMGLGSIDADQKTFIRVSREALVEEIAKSRDQNNGGTDKTLALNVMGALINVNDLVTTAVDKGIKMIVWGAGIPKDLPQVVPDPSVCLVPIISSAKLAGIILKWWQNHYGRAPDAFIIEGMKAGGHLGFKQEQLDQPEIYSLENILQEVLAVVRPYEQQLGRKIPVIVAGGIYTGADIAYMLSLGAAGAQLGTRFVATDECPAAPEFKQAYLDAREEDIEIIHSPVGMLGRVIKNRFLEKVAAKQVKMNCPYHCIKSCDIKTAGFCIARALFNAKKGDLENGLIFAGANVWRVNRIMPVRELIAELVAGIEASPLELPSTSA